MVFVLTKVEPSIVFNAKRPRYQRLAKEGFCETSRSPRLCDELSCSQQRVLRDFVSLRENPPPLWRKLVAMRFLHRFVGFTSVVELFMKELAVWGAKKWAVWFVVLPKLRITLLKQASYDQPRLGAEQCSLKCMNHGSMRTNTKSNPAYSEIANAKG